VIFRLPLLKLPTWSITIEDIDKTTGIVTYTREEINSFLDSSLNCKNRKIGFTTQFSHFPKYFLPLTLSLHYNPNKRPFDVDNICICLGDICLAEYMTMLLHGWANEGTTQIYTYKSTESE
jgi:hypothetical protein